MPAPLRPVPPDQPKRPARPARPVHAARPAGAPARWRAARLLDAPHRLCFFWAGLNWAAAAGWWAAHLLAAALGWPWPWQLPPALAHGLWFSLGAMPLFIAGFMFTAGPKWLRRPPVQARTLRVPVGLFVLGWLVAVPGFHAGLALTAAGLGLVSLGWAGLSWRLARLVAASTQADRRHAWLIVLACGLLLAGLAGSALALALGRAELLRPLLRVGLWGGLSLVFLTVSHRMLPFLGLKLWPALDKRWPDWLLWALLSVPVVQSASALGAVGWPAPPGWVGVQVAPLAVGAASAPLAAVAASSHLAGVAAFSHLAAVAALCLWIALRWAPAPALRQPMVALLYGALLWWDLALWLAAAAHWPGLDASSAAALDLAAVHALGMGFLGGTLLVMATRVSSTHSGRPVAMDRVALALYALLQLALALRLAGALAPLSAWPGLPWLPLLPMAALAWLAVAATWAARHGRWLGLPRQDGRPD